MLIAQSKGFSDLNDKHHFGYIRNLQSDVKVKLMYLQYYME